MAELEPKVLGELSLMQSVVATLPTARSILSFVCQGFRDLPGVGDVSVAFPTGLGPSPAEAEPPPSERFVIQSGETTYAELELTIRDRERFQPYRPYLNNFVTMLGVIFAEREQRDLNHRLLAELEQRVSERTRQLELEIEERKRTEDTLRLNDALLHRSMQVAGQGSVFVEDLSRPWKTSPEFDEICGLTPEFSKRTGDILALIDPEFREAISRELLALLAGQRTSFDEEFTIRRARDQAVRWVRAIGEAAFSSDGHFVGMSGIVQDITAAKLNLLELERSNSELHNSLERIRTINRDLVEAKRRAEESDRLKSAFLANISHEIRTPMNGILGFADLLQNEDLDRRESREYLAIIERSGQRMLNIINDLVDISRLEEGQVKLFQRETSIRGLLDEQAAFFAPKARQKGVELRIEHHLVDPSMTALLDRDRISQVLGNLLSNALKFTDAGRITLRCEHLGETLQFAVADTGIGIPADLAPTIFDRFRQLDDSLARNHEGAGLGLTISKGLVEMHGGRLWVESTVGEGSTFFFTLPISPATPAAELSPAEGSRSLDLPKRSKVLVVEDDEASFQYLDTLLRAHLEVVHARSGLEAVHTMLAPNDIDLILMDIKLPDMDGLEATRRIRARRPRIPVIAQTAFSQNEDRERALHAGCTDFLTKPIDRQMLYGAIRRSLA